MSEADTGSRSTYSIRAVERVCTILDLIQQNPQGLAFNDFLEATDLPKSSTFRYLSTLEARHYVERDPATGRYRLGSAFLPQGSLQLDLMVERARPLLEELRDRFEETINLTMLDGNHIAYLEIVESHKSMRLAARKGDRDPIHSTAAGKAIATLVNPDRVRSILELEGMAPRTTKTITDASDYFAAVSETRERGYALDDGENEEDGRCVAVPIRGVGVPAALSLSAPAARFPLPEVVEVANALIEVSKQLTDSTAGEE